MSAHEGNRFVLPREQTLSVLLYSDEIKINQIKNIHTTIVFYDI